VNDEDVDKSWCLCHSSYFSASCYTEVMLENIEASYLLQSGDDNVASVYLLDRCDVQLMDLTA
jgi:hypothetical protein